MSTYSSLPTSTRLAYLLGNTLGLEVKDYEGNDLDVSEVLDAIEQKVYGPTGEPPTPAKPVEDNEAAPVGATDNEAAQFAAFKAFMASQKPATAAPATPVFGEA